MFDICSLKDEFVIVPLRWLFEFPAFFVFDLGRVGGRLGSCSIEAGGTTEQQKKPVTSPVREIRFSIRESVARIMHSVV